MWAVTWATPGGQRYQQTTSHRRPMDGWSASDNRGQQGTHRTTCNGQTADNVRRTRCIHSTTGNAALAPPRNARSPRRGMLPGLLGFACRTHVRAGVCMVDNEPGRSPSHRGAGSRCVRVCVRACAGVRSSGLVGLPSAGGRQRTAIGALSNALTHQPCPHGGALQRTRSRAQFSVQHAPCCTPHADGSGWGLLAAIDSLRFALRQRRTDVLLRVRPVCAAALCEQ